jgi:hypothetical protein
MAGLRQHRIIAAALLSLALAGCGGPDVAPVSGRITLNGQPLAGAHVTFQPVSPGPNVRPEVAGSVGRTDAAGQYSLRLVEPDRAGALVGEHRVTISTAEATDSDGAVPKGERVPKSWRDGSQRFTVPAGGTSAANFELKSK